MNKIYVTLLFLFSLQLNICRGQANDIYKMQKGKVSFSSISSEELIHASSNQLKGLIDLQKKTFAFKIGIISFMGFNSNLQQEHFNENYMETSQFPDATYSGKIIEDINMKENGTYLVRTKGKLKIHGVEQEQIIKARITCKDGTITVRSDFDVLLSDYDIKIPRVMNNKIANNINVTVEGTFVPGN